MSIDTPRNWIIILACCYINIITYGILRLSGVFFVETMNKFSVERNIASFPYTFVTFMQNISGPVFGYLGQKFNVPFALMIGTLLCTIGIGSCFFVENIIFITIFYGIIFGIGCGSFLLLPVIINQHFDKYRGIANGVCTSGVPLGLFILSPIAKFLIEKYGLSGTFVTLSGLVFNCVPAIMVIKVMKTETASKTFAIIENAKNEIEPLLPDNKVVTLCMNNEVNSYNSSSIRKEQFLNFNSNSKILPSSYQTFNFQQIDDMNANIFTVKSKEISNSCNVKTSTAKNFKNNIYAYKNHKPISQTGKNKLASRNKTSMRIFSNILLDPIFIILAINSSLFSFSAICLTTVIVDFANDIGIHDNIQSYTLMTLSVGELFGPLLSGWVIDKSYMSKTNCFILYCFLLSLINVLIPYCNGSASLLCLLVLYGLVLAPGSSISPLLVADYIDETKQTIAMTSVSLLVAPVSLLISPLIGYLRDYLGSYEYLFYGLGIISLIRGSLILVIPYLWKVKQEKNRKK